jgi:hypothetical protein
MARGFKTGGRAKGTPNKATAELRVYAQQFSREAIDALRVLMKTAEMDVARVMAARELLDRAHGKPAQQAIGPDGETIVVPSSVTFVIKKAESGQH